jgi:hypothetical protein
LAVILWRHSSADLPELFRPAVAGSTRSARGPPRDNEGVADEQQTAGPRVLGELRDRLLDQVLGLLKADPKVDGVALVGSLGRAEADNWSDIDLLILMADHAVAEFMAEPAARPWARAELLSDGRHNSPAGATSVGTLHLRSGLPLWADLHVHPADRTRWPADGRVVFQRRPIQPGTLSFDEVNASGPRQAATAKTAEEIRRIHLSYVPIAAKYVGRRSGRAAEMIRFLGRPEFGSGDPAAQLLALRGIAAELADPSLTWLNDAVTGYLDLVEAFGVGRGIAQARAAELDA